MWPRALTLTSHRTVSPLSATLIPEREKPNGQRGGMKKKMREIFTRRKQNKKER